MEIQIIVLSPGTAHMPEAIIFGPGSGKAPKAAVVVINSAQHCTYVRLPASGEEVILVGQQADFPAWIPGKRMQRLTLLPQYLLKHPEAAGLGEGMDAAVTLRA